MRHIAWVVFGICCSTSVGAQEFSVFTPSGRSDAPVFMNGQVVRIDRAAGTITVRSDGGQRVLSVDPQTLSALGQVRAGSSVILGLRTTGTGASARSVVTDIRPSGAVSPPSGAVSPSRSRVSANASVVSSGARTIGTAQVVGVDTAARRMTVIDSTGARRVLDVRGSAVGSLGTLQAGDTVSLGVAAPLVSGTPAGTVTTIDTAGPRTVTTFGNGSLPPAPGLPPSPNDGISRNPATTGVQPAPGAQPLPGVQGPTGVQPVPGAQPLPGTGVTGQTAANPGLTTQPVPGTTGQTSVNSGTSGQTAGATTGVPGTGAVPGVTGLSGGMSSRGVGAGGTGGAGAGAGARAGATGRGGSSGVTGGGSPVLSPAVPQLGGVSTGGINSQIPSIPPSPGSMNTPVLPPPSVMPQTNPPQTPVEAAAMRELASRDFDMAVAVLGARAAEIDRAWVAYRSQCVSSTSPLNNRSREWFGVLDGTLIAPSEDLCEASYNEVLRLAQGLQASLDNARDTARRADVLPGRMREVQQRYNLDL